MSDLLAEGALHQDDHGHKHQMNSEFDMDSEREEANTRSPMEEYRVAYPVAAINQLPVEILSAIMVIVVDESFGAYHGPMIIPVRVFTPLVLSQVCRLWRQCAHATPQLWCSVLIHDLPDLRKKGELVCPNLRVQTAFLETCVARARALPLELILGIHKFSDDVDASLDVWRSSMGRCRSLDITCPETIWDELFSSPIELPLLEKLELSIFQDITQTPLSLNSLAMPKLKHLEIALEGISDTPDGIDWSRLSTLSIHSATFNRRLGSVLDQCPALRQLELELEVIDIDQMCNITLPFLEDFYCYIHDYDRNGVAKLVFPSFVLPRLQKLTVYAPDTYPLTKSLALMLRRSDCMLETLDIHNRCAIDNGDHFYELLMSCPALSSLTVTSAYGTDDTFASIDESLFCLIRSVDGYPAPKLDCLLLGLEVDETYVCFPSDSAVSEILNARRLHDLTTPLRDADVVIHGVDGVSRMGWFVRDGGEILRKGADDDTLQEDIDRVWRGLAP
ncbi:hypothetical protein OE88DRAFT_1668781 [Heliocybe sulcata]|uniref:Uncharacterized protein n=1 Tax=Heliocybe sulcata TaxID=5364 RepID=A0A5C3MKD2_9AGAM|nr:hypothetical protein OE88DRAFT_1668781 [Heliocybe sulcata]